MLNISRGTQEKSTIPNYLNNAINEVTELLEPELKKYDIKLVNECVTQFELNPKVTQFHQVLLNILINAIQAIETAIQQGRNSEHTIRLTNGLTDGYTCLSIEDTGCGISENNIRNIFNPFFTTKDFGKGIGLGLTMSHRLIDSWGGKIKIKSKINKGTKTCIFLP